MGGKLDLKKKKEKGLFLKFICVQTHCDKVTYIPDASIKWIRCVRLQVRVQPLQALFSASLLSALFEITVTIHISIADYKLKHL
jgi:hypothetical protein